MWAVAKDKADPDRRLFLPVKANIAADGGTGLAYRIKAERDVPRVVWEEGTVTTTADEALATRREPGGGALDGAKDWLRDLLADGPVSAPEVEEEAQGAGLAWATVQRAKRALGVESTREGFGEEGGWRWKLPAKGPKGEQ